MTGTWSRRSEEWTYHPFAQAKEVLRFYRDFSRATHEEVTTYAGLLTSPDGAKKVAIGVCYSGPLEEGERLITPVRQFGRPLADEIQPMGLCYAPEYVRRCRPSTENVQVYVDA